MVAGVLGSMNSQVWPTSIHRIYLFDLYPCSQIPLSRTTQKGWTTMLVACVFAERKSELCTCGQSRGRNTTEDVLHSPSPYHEKQVCIKGPEKRGVC
jgi:hypothetical protein